LGIREIGGIEEIRAGLNFTTLSFTFFITPLFSLYLYTCISLIPTFPILFFNLPSKPENWN
jgi:hypothetical protein